MGHAKAFRPIKKIADPKQIATWINGYYHGAQGSSILDAQAMLEITNTVEEHCFKHPGDLVMKSVEELWGLGNSKTVEKFKASLDAVRILGTSRN
jgi:hypothetical protein